MIVLKYCWVLFANTLLIIFTPIFISDSGLYFSFFSGVFVWFWYQGDSGLLKWVWKHFFIYRFLDREEQALTFPWMFHGIYLWSCLVPFLLFFGEFFLFFFLNHWFNFITGSWFLHVLYFFQIKSWETVCFHEFICFF